MSFEYEKEHPMESPNYRPPANPTLGIVVLVMLGLLTAAAWFGSQAILGEIAEHESALGLWDGTNDEAGGWIEVGPPPVECGLNEDGTRVQCRSKPAN